MGEPVTCGVCGITAETLPVAWSSQVSVGGSVRDRTWLCEHCTRENIRSIEGKLDEVWW